MCKLQDNELCRVAIYVINLTVHKSNIPDKWPNSIQSGASSFLDTKSICVYMIAFRSNFDFQLIYAELQSTQGRSTIWREEWGRVETIVFWRLTVTSDTTKKKNLDAMKLTIILLNDERMLIISTLSPDRNKFSFLIIRIHFA